MELAMTSGFFELSQDEMMVVDGGDFQDAFEILKMGCTFATTVCLVGAALATAPATAAACGVLAAVGGLEVGICEYMSYKAGKMGV